jgi:LemA protein
MELIWIHFTVVIIINIVTFLFLGVAFNANYNSLTKLCEILREAWGHIEAQLQRRYDALLSMSQVIEGYAGHEQSVDVAIAKARTLMGTSGGVGERVAQSTQAEHSISGFMGHVVHIATAFPELKANAHFQDLLNTIQETGNEVTRRRETYNNTVKDYNAFMKKFPTRLYAMYLGFNEASYFSFGDDRADMPEMSFSQQGVLNGAIAGSPQFPADALPGSFPDAQKKAISDSRDAEGGGNIDSEPSESDDK